MFFSVRPSATDLIVRRYLGFHSLITPQAIMFVAVGDRGI